MSKTKGKYTTLHVPTRLANTIDEVLSTGDGAYSSRAEFVKDAVRRHLEYYGFYPPRKMKAKVGEK